jgi:hypothetical protein
MKAIYLFFQTAKMISLLKRLYEERTKLQQDPAQPPSTQSTTISSPENESTLASLSSLRKEVKTESLHFFHNVMLRSAHTLFFAELQSYSL